MKVTKTDRETLRSILISSKQGPWCANDYIVDYSTLKAARQSICYTIRKPDGAVLAKVPGSFIVVERDSISILLDALDAADNMRTVLGKLTGQLGYIDDTPDCWEHAFYHEGKAAADAYDAKVKL